MFERAAGASVFGRAMAADAYGCQILRASSAAIPM
jgi:hypothetical protein